jgi:hypothetical protein
MKLRSIMSVGAMALATMAFAVDDYTDGKVCGWMRIDSNLPITAVGVPWTDVSNPATNVKVADLVKTDTLAEGDKLYVYSNAKWFFYVLNANKEWVAGTTLDNSSVTPFEAGAPSTATIERGQALYLERQNPTSPAYFYVYGAVGTEVATTTLMGATKYLVASPKATAFAPRNIEASRNITGSTAKSRTAAGDQIVVPLAGGATRTYTLAGGKWGYATSTGRVAEGSESYEPVPLGTGFWYVTASEANSITITW